MSDSLWPYGLQHARLLFLPLSSGVCSNSCLLSQWCHPTILFSVAPFSCPQSFPASRTFPLSQLFVSGSQSIGVLASASVLPMNIQDCAHLCIKHSLGISNFLEEISSLSHFTVFLYFFAMITEEGFFIPPCYSSELCIQMFISFLSSLPFASFLFSVICKASSDNHFVFFNFFFLGMVLITASCTMLWTSIHSSSGPLSIRSNPLNPLVISTA